MSSKIPSKMNESQARECITHKLVKVYATEAGKKFIHHLVNAFSIRNTKIITINESNEPLLDCITNRYLKPVYNSRDEFPKEDLMNDIKSKISYETAMGSKISDRILGKLELDELNIWIKNQLESGNEEIRKIVAYNNYTPKKKLNKHFNKKSPRNNQNLRKTNKQLNSKGKNV